MELIRLGRAELYKMRHTILPLFHLLVPLGGSIAFLLYYSCRDLEKITELSGFVQIIGIALPLLAGIICAKSVELEEENHFQTFLGAVRRKRNALFGKWLTLLALAGVSITLGIASFALGLQVLPGETKTDVTDYLILIAVLWIGCIPVYLFHLFLTLRYSQTVSMGVGVAEFLLAALFLTSLGDGLWFFVPCTWSARLGAGACVGLYRAAQPGGSAGGMSWIITWYAALKEQHAVSIGFLIMAVFCVIIFAWFHFYEGRQRND